MTDPIFIVDYDVRWPALFADRAAAMRERLGSVALRIDHVGSTAVPGLAAKPIIDVQISVASFDPLDAFRAPLEGLGYESHADDRAGYTDAKRPFTWEALAAADDWAQRVGWAPGPSDA